MSEKFNLLYWLSVVAVALLVWWNVDHACHRSGRLYTVVAILVISYFAGVMWGKP